MRPLLAALLILPSLVSANPHGILWARGKAPLKAAATPGQAPDNLLYYGGPVIEHAKVYVVLWGDKIDPEIKTKIGPFYEAMLDSAYMDWLSIYDTNLKAVDGREGTKQHIGRGSFGGRFTIKPANTGKALTDAMVQAELEAQIASGVLPPADANTLYMTYFPKGVSITIEGEKSCSSFCAYHEGFNSSRLGAPVYYGVMPTCGGLGCGGGFSSVTHTSSHEAIEAITDPFPTPGSNPSYPQAWNTKSGEEISDVCPNSSTVTSHGATYTVTQNWDNRAGACAKGPWTQNGAAAAELPPVSTLRPAWSAAAGVLAR